MKTVIYLFAAILVMTVSCNRKGCIDIDAKNYNSKSKKDDGSCTYKGDAIVWFDQEKAIDFADSSIAMVSYFIDDVNVGSIDVLNYTGTAPSCFSPKGVTITKELQDKKKVEFELEVRESDGTVISEHTIDIIANDCTPFKLPQ